MEVLLRCGVFLTVVGQRNGPIEGRVTLFTQTDLDLRGRLVERASAGTAAVLLFRASEAPSGTKVRRHEERLYVASFCILTRTEEPAIDVRLLPRLVRTGKRFEGSVEPMLRL